MEINFKELQSIVKTLPTGLYLGRRIECRLSEDAETSYYVPMQDYIVLSFPQIETSLAKATEDSKKESLIRANLYHELSHAFITPPIEKVTDTVNIFEDERIETILADYYLDVNFKESVFLMNGLDMGEVPPPTTVIDAFYHLVRFRCGHGVCDDLLNRVNDIILRNWKLNKDSGYWTANYSYVREIEDLYAEVKKRYPNMEEGRTDGNGNEGSSDGEDYDGNGNSNETKDSNSDGNGNDATSTKMDIDKISKEVGAFSRQATKDKCIGGFGLGRAEKTMKKITNRYIDPNMTSRFEMIIQNFNKKTNSGNGATAYSGVFNPRNVARKDYRYFDKKIENVGNNKFGSCHLNLFIDCSGSFWNSQEIVNTMIKSLSDIERRNKNFSLDIIFCGDGQRIAKEDRILECNEGTHLTSDIFNQFKSLQKKNTFNYNILLYDGYCCCTDTYSYYESFSEEENNFRAFNGSNVTIISDYSNKDNINSACPNAKKVYSNQYTKELQKNIEQALKIAFR